MDLSTIGAGMVGIGVIAGSVWNGWQSAQAKRAAKAADTNAAAAARSAYPVSNGWGSKVAADLDYLRAGMDRTHARMDVMDQRHNQTDARINTLGKVLTEHLANPERRNAS
jgi:hypothetical protein